MDSVDIAYEINKHILPLKKQFDRVELRLGECTDEMEKWLEDIKLKLQNASKKNVHNLRTRKETINYNTSIRTRGAAARSTCSVATKLEETSTRTKPVINSTIFDDKGKRNTTVTKIDSVDTVSETIATNSPKKSIKRMSPEKRDSLDSFNCHTEVKAASTPRSDSVHIQEGNHEVNKCDSRSSASKSITPKNVNCPEKVSDSSPKIDEGNNTGKRAKRTKNKSGEDTENACLGPVTRTKTRKALNSEESDRNQEKSVVNLLARKSLQKAINISLLQARTKALETQKPQPCLSSNVIIKNNENVVPTGSAKVLTLSAVKGKTIITPAKKVVSPETIKSCAKIAKENAMGKELLLQALREKTEEAKLKREIAIKNRQKELKEKNEMKLQSAMKQRERLIMEKTEKLMSEKEKEAKRLLLQQEHEAKKKELTLKKRQLMEQKLAETEERRKLEEKARLAKQAEIQRMLLEKQKEQEQHKKRAQERLADQKAVEKFEPKIKVEDHMMREKILAPKMVHLHSSSKNSKPVPLKKWDYKPRNEDDYGLEDENSDPDSDTEIQPTSNKPKPLWVRKIYAKECVRITCISQNMIMEFMPCHQKSPDIHKMFKMTPSKRIKRTSSAIWNTPSS